MWILLVILARSGYWAPVVQQADQCADTSSTTRSMETCAQKELAELSDTLARVEATIEKVHGPTGLAGLRSAASSWRSYRDLQCEWVYQSYDGGSMRGLAAIDCEIRLTRERIAFLRTVEFSGEGQRR